MRTILTACILLLVTACKKEPIGISYVIGPKVEVRAEPVRTSKVIANPGRNERIEILAKQVRDSQVKTDGALWYKVRYRDLTGFVSYEEEGIRQNISTFEPAAHGSVGIVSASNLRIRETPGLQGNVLKTLPRGTVVDIVAYGSIYQSIEGKQDRWVEIRMQDGRQGFAFAGFLRRETREKISEPEKAAAVLGDSARVDTTIEITAQEPRFLSSPGGSPVSESDPGPCGEKSTPALLPKPGSLVKANETQTADSKVYYHFTMTSGGVNYCDGGVSAWIIEDDVSRIDDVFTHTLDQGHPERQLLAEANIHFGGNMNAREAEIRGMPNLTGKPDRSFYLVTGRGVCNSEYCPKRGLLFERAGNRFTLLGKMNEPHVQDLDGDGLQELITTDSERASVTSTLYAYKNGTYEAVLQSNAMAPFEIEGNRITVQSYAGEGWVSEVYEYRNGAAIKTR